jgi:hypothetical protein
MQLLFKRTDVKESGNVPTYLVKLFENCQANRILKNVLDCFVKEEKYF